MPAFFNDLDTTICYTVSKVLGVDRWNQLVFKATNRQRRSCHPVETFRQAFVSIRSIQTFRYRLEL